MTQNFKAMVQNGGDLKLTRKGIAEAVVVPEQLLKNSGFDANIEGTQIVLSQGNSTYILADKIALGTTLGEAEANIFFVEAGMVIELVDGQIILFDKDNEPFIVNQDAEIDYPRTGNRIRVLTAEDLREKAEIIIKNRYGLTHQEDVEEYTDNLLLNTVLSYASSSGEPCLTVRIPELYEDLGVEQFNFVNYKEHKAFLESKKNKDEDDHIDISQFDDEDLFEDDEEEEDDFDMSHADDEDDDF